MNVYEYCLTVVIGFTGTGLAELRVLVWRRVVVLPMVPLVQAGLCLLIGCAGLQVVLLALLFPVTGLFVWRLPVLGGAFWPGGRGCR